MLRGAKTESGEEKLEKPWKDDFEELDDLLFQNMRATDGAFWPPLAIALALIDKGVVDKETMLTIIDALRDIALGWAEPGYGEDDARALQQMYDFLEAAEVSEGKVLRELRTLGAGEMLRALRRAPSRRSP